ncbi:MAG: DNA translocase FtsK 4TM domain-containing protein, partial [Chloroflexi bacterium]|nr:DNA translocase FtsK 4TM domain-containing protein [Chloroflexota bacterium]
MPGRGDRPPYHKRVGHLSGALGHGTNAGNPRPPRRIGFGLFFLTFAAFPGAAPDEQRLHRFHSNGRAETGGGYLGGLIGYSLTEAVGTLGAIFILVIVGLARAILMMGLSRHDLAADISTLCFFVYTRRGRGAVARKPTSPSTPAKKMARPSAAASRSRCKCPYPNRQHSPPPP